MAVSARRQEEIRERLRHDLPFFAENCLTIIPKSREKTRLVPRPWQLRLEEKIREQRDQGLPARGVICKARQLGFSTWGVAHGTQASTQRENQKAIVIAQDMKTAGELFEMHRLMWANLPIYIKPDVISREQRKYHRYGNGSRAARDLGDFGINSSFEVDTAGEFDAGRGYTFTHAHLSEVAYWPSEDKMTAVLNAVPDEPGTLILLESTAKGKNFFYDHWQRAVSGESGFFAFFAAWHEDPAYTRPFAAREDRLEFASEVGSGPYGEDEPRLVEQFALSLEQLHWRRWCIAAKCEGKLDVFKREYPSSAEEAFLSKGRHVFSMVYVQRVIDRAERSDPQAEVGVIRPSGVKTKAWRSGTLEVPTGAMWVPQAATGFPGSHPWWRVWEQPVTEASEAGKPPDERRPLGQYVGFLDPAGDEETSSGEGAYYAIEILDHRTGAQVAEWRGRMEPDAVAEQFFLAGLFYNGAWLAPEITGGYGLAIMKLLRNMGYPRLYRRPKQHDSTHDKTSDRLGWSTDRKTKPQMEAGMHELLREGTDGVRSRLLAMEFTTYVKDERGRHRPERNAFSDLLMAYMGAHEVRRLTPLRTDGPRVKKLKRTRDPVTGW